VIRVHSGDVDEYAANAGAFLAADPCARNVLLSVLDTVRAAPATYGAAPSFWWITDSTTVVGAATWTPPYGMLVSSLPDEAAAPLGMAAVARASEMGIPLPGVNGPAASARAVAAAIADVTGVAIERDRSILLNELRSLTGVPLPEGARRTAGVADVPLIATWLEAFSAEVQHPAPADPLAFADRMVRTDHYDLWIVDDRAVCLVGHHVAAGVVRIGPVYTPPESRNRGYARRLTYEVTAQALAQPDIHHAMLFTDAANPVSNSIYRQAGYEPRDEHVEIELGQRDRAAAP